MKELVFDPEQPLSKLFFWALEIVDAFTEKYSHYEYKNGTNLCHFIRVIVFYMPLTILSQLITWTAVLGAGLILPLYLFHWKVYLIGLGVVVGAIVVIIGGIVGFGLLMELYDERKSARSKGETEAQGEPTTTGVILAFLAAQKQKICPFVKFSEEAEHA